MPFYVTLGPLTVGKTAKGADGGDRLLKTDYAAGRTVELDDFDGARLVRLGKVIPAPDGSAAPRPGKARETAPPVLRKAR